eukprot:TRINITY_DN3564_c0_g1_i1.p1 TRINITY_DN3564_c0_g1~~TRINITY_DN3564_c0_g1_i1.p1  ORF type:complete len:414 (-),score=28.68 TRINITY_DN3564_c0_g1_i1:1244-2485(-)
MQYLPILFKVDRLFDSPQSSNAALLISPENLLLLSDLYKTLEQLHETTYKTQVSTPIKGKINELIRNLSSLILKNCDKETGLMFYWYFLLIMTCMERLQSVEVEKERMKKQKFLQSSKEDAKAEAWEKFQEAIRNNGKAYQEQIAQLEAKLADALNTIQLMEKEAVIAQENHNKMVSNIETSSVMEDLGVTYGKVREALNKTYDSQAEYVLLPFITSSLNTRQYNYLNEYIKIAKDIVIKSKKEKADVASQTNLSLTEISQFQNVYANPVPDNAITNLAHSTFAFLNTQLLEAPAKKLYQWEEVYRTSECILSSQNNLMHYIGSDSSRDVNTKNMHDACLFEFFTKFSDFPQRAASELYAYLNVRGFTCNYRLQRGIRMGIYMENTCLEFWDQMGTGPYQQQRYNYFQQRDEN